MREIKGDVVTVLESLCRAKSGRRLHGSAVLIAAGMGLITVSASAQQPSGEESRGPRTETLEEIIVTGTLIDRPGFEAPTPTTVIGEIELRQAGRDNVAEVLADIPQFRFSVNPSTNAGFNSVSSASGDLRALGFSRTLFLLNGRRFIGEFDLNSLPFAAVKQIDVVTGGASATYGSGAVAGVVNVVLNDEMNGVQVGAQTGRSSREDGEQYRYDITAGTDFADGRGNVLLSAEYFEDEGITPLLSRESVAQFGVVANPTFTPTNGQARNLFLPNVGLAIVSEGGLALSGPFAGQQFLPGGALAPFNRGTIVSGAFGSGGEGPTFNSSFAVRAPLERQSALTAASYDLTDALRLSADVRYANVKSGTGIIPDFSVPVIVRTDNAFLPAAARAQLVAAGAPAFALGRYNSDFGLFASDVERETYQGSIALDGSFGKTFGWNVYYTHGEQQRYEAFEKLRIGDNFAQAVDSVIDTRAGSPTSGQPICRVALTAATTCVPLNLFGAGAPSAAALEYVLGTTSADIKDKLDVAAATLRGDPFSLWAGPVSIAVGAEYRKESSRATVDPISAAQRFPTFFFRPFGPDRVSVKEAFGEILVPLVKDVPLLRNLEFNGAARYSDYSTSGGIWAWKLGLTNELFEGLRLRAVRSRDIRAPNLGELGGPGSTIITTVTDPFTGTTPVVTLRSTGNADLVPEEADTVTAGLVFEPSFAPGLSISADYYSIDIKDAITTLNGQSLITLCFRDPNSPACGQIERLAPVAPATIGQISIIRANALNIATFKTSGVDAEISYRMGLDRLIASAPGTVTFRVLGGYVDELIFDDGVSRLSVAGDLGSTVAGVSRLRGVVGATYAGDRFSVDLRARYLGGGHFNSLQGSETSCDPVGRTAICPDIAANTSVDLGLQYALPLGDEDSRLTLFGSVTNLFDRVGSDNGKQT